MICGVLKQLSDLQTWYKWNVSITQNGHISHQSLEMPTIFLRSYFHSKQEIDHPCKVNFQYGSTSQNTIRIAYKKQYSSNELKNMNITQKTATVMGMKKIYISIASQF